MTEPMATRWWASYFRQNSVVLPSAVWRRILEHAARDAPRECCGLLIGQDIRIQDVWPARNELGAVSQYRIDARDHFAAIRHARASGMTIVGAYHSHPRSAPV